jgi:hypothetical protein
VPEAYERSTSMPASLTADRDQPYGRRKLVPTLWAQHGFAAIPTAALDPQHRATSPTVPALHGSGSPAEINTAAARVVLVCRAALDRLRLSSRIGEPDGVIVGLASVGTVHLDGVSHCVFIQHEVQMGNRKDRKTISPEFKDLAGNLRKCVFYQPKFPRDRGLP